MPAAGLARFLNCCRAEDSAKHGPCRGPGPYLPVALALLLVGYLSIIAPHLEVIWRVRWMPLNPLEPLEFAITGVAAAVIGSLLASLVLSVVAWRLMGRSIEHPGETQSPAWVSPFLMGVAAGVVVLLVVGVVRSAWQDKAAYAFPRLDDAGRNALLRLARVVALPSGISPFFSTLFMTVAGLAWVYSQLNRRFLFEQYTPEIPPPAVGQGVASGDAMTMQSIQQEHARIYELIMSPARRFLTTGIIPTATLAAYVLLFTVPVVSGPVSPLGGGLAATWSDGVAALLIALTFALLGAHTLQLIILWRRLRRAMNLVLHLPLVSALDRIPSRVASWLKEAPRPGDGRFELIRRQALALARHAEGGGGSVKGELEAVLGREIPAGEWEGLNRGLEDVRPETVAAVVIPIRDALLEYWRPAPVGSVFADAPTSGWPKAGAADGGIPQELRAIAMAVARAEVRPPEAPKRLPEWVRLAEDLLAMFVLRWLGASLAQVWTLIGFLVVGSLALLLAISSYPFPFQERLLLGMAVLMGTLAFMILMIVVGFNRDEMISRLSNTSPNRLKFDHQLVGSLLTYIVPLVGALAALSIDATATLRTLFDPILRHLR